MQFQTDSLFGRFHVMFPRHFPVTSLISHSLKSSLGSFCQVCTLAYRPFSNATDKRGFDMLSVSRLVLEWRERSYTYI